MKPEKKFLSQLSDKSGPFTVKVKVIDKTRKQTSPKASYQKITLEDEQGKHMRATMFNDAIEAYEDVIQTQSIYEITNAAIKPVNERYLSSAEELKFQLNFNNRTMIQKVGQDSGEDAEPYTTIDSLHRVVNSDDRYDILVVPIFVEPLRTVKGRNQEETSVREIVVMDSSSDQALVISAWSDFATDACPEIEASLPTYPVFVFTQLKPTKYKGFTLATTLSTLLKPAPRGPKADALREWAKDNLSMLFAKEQHIQNARNPAAEAQAITIAELKAKKYKDVVLEDKFQLNVCVPRLNLNNARSYLGCSHCGRSGSRLKDAIYECGKCLKKDVRSIPRMGCSFEAADHTGSSLFQAFTEEAESLLSIQAAKLYARELTLHYTRLNAGADSVLYEV